MSVVHEIAKALQAEIRHVPERFYSSFDYTRTRSAYTHPITLGLLAKILWSIPSTGHVGIDVRLNLSGGIKFQPDLVVFDHDLTRQLLYVDYESPNSCDSRIPMKDVAAYQKWRVGSKSTAPYLLVTTLPCTPSSDWELRWASKGKKNYSFRPRIAELRENPFKFWYSHYADNIPIDDLHDVHFINIQGKEVQIVDWAKLRKT